MPLTTEPTTIPGYLQALSAEFPNVDWLRDLKNGQVSEVWTWSRALNEVNAVASVLEERFGHQEKMVILSNNRAHWVLADNAIIASGNVMVSMFTTLTAKIAQYILEFSDTEVIFVGDAANWNDVHSVMPEGVTVVALPGVILDCEHIKWEDLLAEGEGRSPKIECKADDVMSLVFTSGTTGLPKGVIQTHTTNLLPMIRCKGAVELGEHPQYFSYLPLSHIAERQLIEFSSMITGGSINFNENMTTLLADLQVTKPVYFFGPPRVWEQFQQAIISNVGSQEALDKMLSEDKTAAGKSIIGGLGLDELRYCLTAAAATPPALISWFEELGLFLLEGFGQTEAMALTLSTPEQRIVGSVGKAAPGVVFKIDDNDELLVQVEACSPGYYKRPEKTAELWIDGWLHTGDKARIDENGFVYITGRVKDYFKTIQGKYVAPSPIEHMFSDNDFTEQHCLMGRGYSKTVMACVLGTSACDQNVELIEGTLKDLVDSINNDVEKHARIGAILISKEAWTIGNETLTPTLKVKRDEIENRFGELAQRLAKESAETKKILISWVDELAVKA